MAENAKKMVRTELKSEEQSQLRVGSDDTCTPLLKEDKGGSQTIADAETTSVAKENSPPQPCTENKVGSDQPERAGKNAMNPESTEGSNRQESGLKQSQTCGRGETSGRVEEKAADRKWSEPPAMKAPSSAPLSLPNINTLTTVPHRGLFRHWSVVGTCLALAGGILGLSMLDLNSLIKREATIDENLHLTYFAKPDQLPPNMSFKRNPSYVGGHWTPRDYSSYTQEGPRMREGLLPVVESSWGKTKEGFVDASGKVVIPPQFNAVGDFHDGLALAQPAGGEHWGYIDHSGKFVIKPIYKTAYDFRKTLANVATDKDHILIDRNGNTITTGAIRDLGFGYLVKKAGKYGIVDGTGAYILSPQYDQISSFSNDASQYPSYPYGYSRDENYAGDPANATPFLKVKIDGKWGVIDKTGNFVLEPKYSGIVSFKNGHAGVVINGKIGFVDLSGKMVINPSYDFATAYDDLIAVRIGKDWQLIRPTGKVVLDTGIDGVLCSRSGEWLADGLGPVITNKLFGFVDKNGVMVIPPSFHYVTGFSNGHAAVWDGTFWRFINTRGEYLSNQKFAMLHFFAQGQAPVEIPGPLYLVGNRREITSEESRLISAATFFTLPTIQWMRDLDNHVNQSDD